MEIRKVLLLCGGMRTEGTSYSFARTLMTLFEEKSIQVSIDYLKPYGNGKSDMGQLAKALEEVDLIGIIAPVYVDTLSAIDLIVFEKLYKNYREILKGKNLFAIGQCGFPDITRCEPIVDYCRLFSAACGINFLGGLGYGGGPLINGAYLETLGRKGKRITKGFTRAINKMIEGKCIDQESQDLIEEKVPRWMYRPIAYLLNTIANKQAKEMGIEDLNRPVYLED